MQIELRLILCSISHWTDSIVIIQSSCLIFQAFFQSHSFEAAYVWMNVCVCVLQHQSILTGPVIGVLCVPFSDVLWLIDFGSYTI